MPPVALHCIVHQIPRELQRTRFPAIYAIKTSSPRDSAYYSLGWMMLWATVPYTIWQLSYHFLITVRRREKIAAGRPTSFTWLRKSYSKNWLGKSVLALPPSMQEPAFMLIQYIYAAITMLPCPIWFRYRWLSASFLLVVFTWSIWNGANFYLDVFGRRFQNELEKLKEEVAKWQSSPEYPANVGSPGPTALGGEMSSNGSPAISRAVDASLGAVTPLANPKRTSSIDQIPLLDGRDADASGADNIVVDLLTKRNS
ncbi:MAG: hypothetical protein M1823_004675 [Watsoniomyces obsoletus]|nr:MAG: hypothetical protein M1823_004675 [Watsoniomyces obsoletus]